MKPSARIRTNGQTINGQTGAAQKRRTGARVRTAIGASAVVFASIIVEPARATAAT